MTKTTTTTMMDNELYQSINGMSQSEFIAELIDNIEKQEIELKTATATIDALKQLNNRSKILIHRARIDIDQQKIDLNRDKFEQQQIQQQ